MFFNGIVAATAFFSLNNVSLIISIVSVLLILVLTAVSVAKAGAVAEKKADAINKLTFALDAFEDRKMENLSELSNTAAEIGEKIIAENCSSIKTDSEILYKGEWSKNPRDYYKYENLLSESERFSLDSEISLSIIVISALFSVILFVLNSFTQIPQDKLHLGFFPLLLGVIASVTSYLYNRSKRKYIKKRANELCLVYERKIPVYDEKSGTALLINKFLDYDRKMSDSVSLLTEKVRDLSDKKLIDTVSESIETVLKEELAPSIEKSNEALSNLCVELTGRQTEGMKELSKSFSDSLSETVSASLMPLQIQIKAYADQLDESKNALHIAFEQYNHYRNQAAKLDEKISLNLSSLKEEAEKWNASLIKMNTIAGKIADNNTEMAKLQKGSEENLAGKLSMMAESISSYGELNKETLKGLKEENIELGKLLSDTQGENQRLLGDYRHLSQRMSMSAMDIEKQNAVISENITKLNNSLDDSVKHFTNQLQAGVNLTLSDFDSGLAELTERISHTATIIRDSLSKLADSVNMGER